MTTEQWLEYCGRNKARGIPLCNGIYCKEECPHYERCLSGAVVVGTKQFDDLVKLIYDELINEKKNIELIEKL